jgi:hypothetical protein
MPMNDMERPVALLEVGSIPLPNQRLLVLFFERDFLIHAGVDIDSVLVTVE